MWKTIVNVLDEFVGHAFGFPDCHPSCFLGVAVLDSWDLVLMLLSVDAGFVVLWWFENWIVDASKMRDFFCFDFLLLSISTGSFCWSRLIVL